MTATPPVFPFVVGSGRSGTTLLRAMLDSHPLLAVPDEVSFIVRLSSPHYAVRYGWPRRFDAAACTDLLLASGAFRRWRLPEAEVRAALAAPAPTDLPDVVRRVYALFAALQGKPRYADKTPTHVLHLPRLGRLFPESRFVHLVRDGRDVALSYCSVAWGPSTVAEAAVEWRRRVAAGRRAGRRLGAGRYLEVPYESLVASPEPVLRKVCAFLALPYDPAMLDYPDRAGSVIANTRFPEAHQRLRLAPTRGLRDWRRDMAPADVAAFEAVAGSVLTAFGYERAVPSPGPRSRVQGAAVVARGTGGRWAHDARAGVRIAGSLAGSRAGVRR
jgi:hypothetical protein